MAVQFTLRATDMRDRELLALIADHSDDSGYADTEAIASALWPRAMGAEDAADRKAAMGAVATRLAWLVRYGIVLREPNAAKTAKRRWGLTEEGAALLQGTLSSGEQNTIANLKGMKPVLAVASLADRREGELVSTLMRRAWAFGGRR